MVTASLSKRRQIAHKQLNSLPTQSNSMSDNISALWHRSLQWGRRKIHTAESESSQVVIFRTSNHRIFCTKHRTVKSLKSYWIRCLYLCANWAVCVFARAATRLLHSSSTRLFDSCVSSVPSASWSCVGCCRCCFACLSAVALQEYRRAAYGFLFRCSDIVGCMWVCYTSIRWI